MFLVQNSATRFTETFTEQFYEDCSDKGLQNSVYQFSVNYCYVNVFITLSVISYYHYCESLPFEPVELVEVDCRSHKSIVPSRLPDANVLPSGLKEILLTQSEFPPTDSIDISSPTGIKESTVDEHVSPGMNAI